MQSSKKIVILGHFGVGKSSLVRRFVEDSFSEDYKVTIGVHITKKVVKVTPNDTVSLIIWDLEGTDDLETIRSAYLLGTHAVFFVFDVTRPSTFQNINKDLDLVTKKTGEIPLLVIGNKIDLINMDELKDLLQKKNISCDFFTSAKTGGTVEDAFVKMATLLSKNV